MSRSSSDIPGFYYDDSKRRYFRILPTAYNADREALQPSKFLTTDCVLGGLHSETQAANVGSSPSSSLRASRKRRTTVTGNVSRAHVLESLRTNTIKVACGSQLVQSSQDCRSALAVIETSALRERCRVNIAWAARTRNRDVATDSALPGRRHEECECLRAQKLVGDPKSSRMLIVARSSCAAHSLCGLYRLALDRKPRKGESTRACHILTNWTGPSTQFLAYALVRDDLVDACALQFSDKRDGASTERQSDYLAVSNSSLTVYSHRTILNGRAVTGEHQIGEHLAAPQGDVLRCCAATRVSRRVAVCSEAACRVFDIAALRDGVSRRCLTDVAAISTFRIRNALTCAFFDQAIDSLPGPGHNSIESLNMDASVDVTAGRNNLDAVLLGTKSGSVHLCDMRDCNTRKQSSMQFEHGRAISHLQAVLSASSFCFVASDFGGSVRIWDIRVTTRPVAHIEQRFSEPANCPFSINEDASIVFTVSNYGHLSAYRLWTAQRLSTIPSREPIERNRPIFQYSSNWPANVGAHALAACYRSELALYTYF